MTIVSIVNYKGGVGKTTMTYCSAQALAVAGFRVLVIDNDCQHNLSMILKVGNSAVSIRDVYRAGAGEGWKIITQAIQKTAVMGLDIIPSSTALSNSDVKDPFQLQKCINSSKLRSIYDFILIDNPPGLDKLQESSIHVSDQIFVPTQTTYFALEGIHELDRNLNIRFRGEYSISKIIPNFYRDSTSDRNFIGNLLKLYPGKVTDMRIPFDPVYLSWDGSARFFYDLYPDGIIHYVKLLQELFDCITPQTAQNILDRIKRELNTAGMLIKDNNCFRKAWCEFDDDKMEEPPWLHHNGEVTGRLFPIGT